jgi:alpha-tubulin suppressor-like RCC1 family protein
MRKTTFITLTILAMLLLSPATAMAVTEFVSTIKASGGDYSSLTTWEAANQCDLTAGTTRVFSHSGITGSIPDGSSVTGNVSGTTATVVHASATQILLKNISGTFWLNESIMINAGNYVSITDTGDMAASVARIEGAWASADTSALTIDGWTTSNANYIRIYSVYPAHHPGLWSTSAYRLVVTAAANDTSAINIKENNVRVEGIQIQLINSGGYTGCRGIQATGQDALSVINVEQCLVRGTLSNTNSAAAGIYLNSTYISSKVLNNIVYDFINGSTADCTGIRLAVGGTYQVYNNTIYGCYEGIRADSSVTITMKNNLANGNTTDYYGSFDVTGYNISETATSPDTSFRGKAVTFVDEASRDLHLGSADTYAKNTGTSLSTIFTDDAEDFTRQGTWDIGASEYGFKVWDGGGADTSWSTAANWDHDAVPATTDIVVFNGTSSKDCVLAGTVTVAGLYSGPQYTGTLSTANNALTVNGNFDWRGGTFSAGSSAVSVSGNWINAATVTAGTSTVTFTATSTGKTVNAGGSAFYNIIFNGSGGGWTTANNMTVGNNMTLSAGTFGSSLQDNTITIASDLFVNGGTLSGGANITVNGGDVTGNGTVYLTGGTFLVDATGSFGGTTDWTFYNLTFGDGTGTAATTKTGSNAITVLNGLRIATNQTLEAGTNTWNIYWQYGSTFLSSVTQVIAASNGNTSYAITSDGAVYGWGYNSYGQTGDGSPNYYVATPVRVLKGAQSESTTYLGDAGGDSRITALSASGDHVLALTAGGAVYAWGYNGDYKLGDGTGTNRFTPIRVLKGQQTQSDTYLGDAGGENRIIAISACNNLSAALTLKGDLYVWGDNEYAQAGLGYTNSANNAPMHVLKGAQSESTTYLGDAGGNARIVAISVLSSNTLAALTAGGAVYAWGRNYYGECGNNTVNGSGTSYVTTPVRVLKGAQSESTTYLGDAGGDAKIIAINGTGDRVLALTAAGAVYGWGRNYYGSLGTGVTTETFYSTPIRVLKGEQSESTTYLGDAGGNSAIVAIATCGYNTSHFITAEGTIYSCGNNNGQLGIGSTSNRYTPARMLKGAQSESTTYLGDAGGDAKIVSMSGGQYHLLLLTAGGTMYTVGYNNYYQLADGTATTRTTPIRPLTINTADTLTSVILKSVTNVNAGYYKGAAVTSDGLVYMWGRNDGGSLGDGTTFYRSTPTLVLKGAQSESTTYLGDAGGDSAIIDAQGGYYSCSYGLTADGIVYAWGSRRLGNGTTGSSYTPIKVLKGEQSESTTYLGDAGGTSKIIAIRSGFNSQYNGGTVWALTAAGAVYAWGRGGSGELGIGTTTDALSPVRVLKGEQSESTTYLGDAGGDSAIVAISGNYYRGMALTSGGAVYAWGLNDYGQLGDGTTTTRLTPVRVLKGAQSESTTYLGDAGGNSKIVGIYGDTSRSYAVTAVGTVYAWGYNGYGYCGDGTATTPRLTPVKVLRGEQTASTIYLGDAGGDHAIISVDGGLALTAGGAVYAIGGEQSGGWTGINQTTWGYYYTPKRMLKGEQSESTTYIGDAGGESRIVQVSCYLGNFSLVRTAAGEVYAMGSNSGGQLGINSTIPNYYVPMRVFLLGYQPFVVSGTLTPETSTFRYILSASTSKRVAYSLAAPTSYYNLTVDNASERFTIADNLSTAGNFTITSGSFDVGFGNLGITCAGNWANSGTFRPRVGTVTFDGSDTQTLNNGTSSFYNIIHSGAGTLQLSTNNLTATGTLVNSAGTWNSNARTVTATGLATLSGGTYQASTAKQTFNSGLTISGGTLTASSGEVETNGNFALSSGAFSGSTGALDVNGNMSLSGTGTLTAPSGAFTVSGNWAKSGGTFTPGSNTVTLDGGSQTLTGSTTFYNLTKSTATPVTLTFDNTAVQTITGLMNWNGAAGGGVLTLRSNSAGNQWGLVSSGTHSVGYVDVKDSDASAGNTITAPHSVDSGNNLNWNVSAVLTNAAVSHAITGGSLVVGVTGNVRITFTTDNAIPSGGKVRVTFPSGYSFNSGGSTAITATTGFTVAPTGVSIAGQLVTLTGAQAAAGATCTITLSNVKNQPDTGTTGTYAIATLNASDAQLDLASAVAANTITNGGTLTSTNVEPASLYAGASGNVTVNFTSVNPIPADGKIEVTFPSGFVISNGGTTGATSATMDGALAVSINGQVVTVTRSGGTQQAAAAETLTLTYIRVPTTAGSTGTYTIRTASSSGSSTGRIDQNTAVSADTILRPSLSSWDLDMNAGTMTLHFDTTVSVASLNVAQLTLQDAATATATYSLTDSTSGSSNGANITITLSTTDLNAIKFISGLGKSAANSYLRLTSSAISDPYANTVTAIADGSARQVASYTADTTAPALNSWALNLNTHQLTLNFSEVVKASSFTASGLTLQNTVSSPTVTYALTDSATASPNGTSIVVTFSVTDFNTLIDTASICRQADRSDSYLTVTSAAITDMAATPNSVTALSSGMQAATYTANTVAATKFHITTSAGAGSTSVTAGSTKDIILKAYDNDAYRTPTYTGSKSVTFAGSDVAPDGNAPTARDSSSNDIAFGTATTLTFTRGEASSTLILYCKALAGSEALIAATEGSVITDDFRLTTVVNPQDAMKMVFSQNPSATGTINTAFTQQPVVSIRDPYGNQTASTNTVTLYASTDGESFAMAPGTLSSDQPGNAIAAVNGAATFSGVKYDMTGTIYLFASAPPLSSAFSTAVTLAVTNTTAVEAAASPVASFNLDPVNDTLAEKFNVLKFKVADKGSDLTPTLLDQVTIAIAGTAGAAAGDIAWAGLYKAGVTDPVATATGSAITNATITFGAAPNSDSTATIDIVPDSSSVEYTVAVYMKNSKLTAVERQTYTFTTDNDKIGCDQGQSSQMKSTNDAAVAVVTGTVSVTATHLELVNQSTGATSGSAIAGSTSELQLRATDSNRNIDKDYAGVHAVAFYGLSAAGSNTPKIESTSFGTELGIYFPVSPGGVSTSNAVTLTPYKMETANIYGSETGMSSFTYNVNVLAASAASIALTSGNNQVSVINKAITPFVVTTQDLYGNAAAGTDVTFSISSYPTGGGGSSLSTTTTATNSSGQASTILTLGAAAGTYQVQATNAALTGSPVTFTATASAPTALEKVSGDAQTKYVNQAADAFVVRLVNESGTGISNETISFAITSYPSGATGQSLSAATAVTNSQGQASTILTLGNKTGSYVVRASYQILGGSLLTSDFTVTAQPAVPYKAVLTGPTSVNAGAASTAFTVTIRDQSDNPSPLATGQSILFNLTTTPGATGTFYSDSACTAGNEITTVTVTEGNSTAVFYYKHTEVVSGVQATVTTTSALLNASYRTSSVTFSVVPASMHHFVVTASDTSAMTAGGERVLTVTSYDIYNNLTQFTGSLDVIFSGASASPSPAAAVPTCSNASGTDVSIGGSTVLSFSNSVATTTFKAYRAGTVLIKATSGSVTTSDAQALNLVVRHSTADHMKFHAALPTPLVAGTAFNFDTTLDVVDVYDNICDGANGAAAYTASGRTITYTLSGTANGPESGVDVYTTLVSFAAGQSTTDLSATLFCAQTTTVTASMAALTGANVASNSLVVNAAVVNKLRFAQQPSITAVTNTVLTQQPQVAISDQYGNACSNVTGQITLRASTTTGSYTPVTNGSLTSTSGLTLTTTNGVAAFTGVKYSYPEEIYLEAEASISGYTVDPLYSFKVTVSTLAEVSVAAVTTGISNTVSSVANSSAQRVAVFAFRATDAGADGYAIDMNRIVVNRATATDTTSDWRDYIAAAYISDGTVNILGTVAANTITFGSGATTIFSVPNASNKTYTLSLVVKSTLPLGADNKVFAFSLDPNDDITLNTPATSSYAAAAALTDNAALTVEATKLRVRGSGGESSVNVNAGEGLVITIAAMDTNNNIDADYDPDLVRNITFSGASTSILGNVPTATDLGGGPTEFGLPTPIRFSGGGNTSTITMVLYQAETAYIVATDDRDPALTTTAQDRLCAIVAGGSAATLAWSTQPTPKAVASAPWKQFVVAVSDAYGNTASSSIDVTITPTGGSTGSGATDTVTAVDGLAIFSNYFVTCPGYPGYVTLVASGAGVTNSAACNTVSVDEKYTIIVSLKDSVNATDLSEFTYSVTDAASGSMLIAETPTNSPFTLSGSGSLGYGTYNFTFAKDLYVETTAEKTLDAEADGLDGAYDNSVSMTVYMTSIAESTADYSVKSSFVYDEEGEDLAIRLWLERRGKLIYNTATNKLGSGTYTAKVQVYDEAAGEWLNTISMTQIDPSDLTNGTYTKTVADILTAGNEFGRVLAAGKTYFAKCTIYYGGMTGAANTYEAGTTFTVTITQKLAQEIISKLGLSEGETLSGKLSTLETSIQTAESNIKTQVAGVKTDTASIATATQTTLPNQISAATTDIQTKVETSMTAAILNRETIVMQGDSVTIQYRTYAGVSPTITVYDPKGVAKVLAAPMTEYAAGLYGYTMTFMASWKLGDYSIVCSEATYGTIDAITMTLTSADVESISSDISTIMGSVSPIQDMNAKVQAFSAAFSVIEQNIQKASEALAGVRGGSEDMMGATKQLEAVHRSLKDMSSKIHQMSNSTDMKNIEKLYQVSEQGSQNITYIRNKTQELKALMLMNQQMVENVAKEEPVVQTWFEYT